MNARDVAETAALNELFRKAASKIEAAPGAASTEGAPVTAGSNGAGGKRKNTDPPVGKRKRSQPPRR